MKDLLQQLDGAFSALSQANIKLRAYVKGHLAAAAEVPADWQLALVSPTAACNLELFSSSS